MMDAPNQGTGTAMGSVEGADTSLVQHSHQAGDQA